MTREQTALLDLKQQDLRMLTIRQCVDAVDQGIHIGGAYSALVPLTALFYGGFIHPNIEHPTDPAADAFVLSKGHAVASMASVYVDLGYFGAELLSGSRAWDSQLNGHPGPILPGVPVSTGPLGHGISVSCALAGVRKPLGANVFCMVGDGELQEGSNWEGILYAAERGLSNLCVLVDRNHGQSDDSNRLVVELGALRAKFQAFGWNAIEADGTSIESVSEALAAFTGGAHGGRPTAIICDTRKGFGGHIAEAVKHKATLKPAATDAEIDGISGDIRSCEARLMGMDGRALEAFARRMNYRLALDGEGKIRNIERIAPTVKVKRAAPRDKRVRYDPRALPEIVDGTPYLFDEVVKRVMRAFTQDQKVCSVDSDLSNTSGLLDGVAQVDPGRALNAGIAECLMMCLAEGYAAEGYNAWCSTFAVFFDARAMRRIAVSQQERMECIAGGGWLSEGHGLDVTFLATAPNLETQTNGATHMGNDDALMYGEMAHVRIIDVCCPRQLVAVMRWIAEGNRGLVYVRVPRMPAVALYPEGCAFEYGRAVELLEQRSPDAVIVSSGRGVHEALAAARLLEPQGVRLRVVDMASADAAACVRLAEEGVPVLFAEQNNGYLFRECLAALARAHAPLTNIHQASCLKPDGEKQFIHSGTYPQLTNALGLSARQLADRVLRLIV